VAQRNIMPDPEMMPPQRERRRSIRKSPAHLPIEPLETRGDKPIVLVVDDDSDCRTIYTMYLRSVGCDVFTANDGRAAIDKTNMLWPDVIVMDLAMPVVDGWEAIRQLHESSWTRQIPIIAVSALPTARDTAFEAGCDAYLTKPCDPGVLWSQIQALLRLSQFPQSQIT